MFFFFYKTMVKEKKISKLLELELVLLNGTASIEKIKNLKLTNKALEQDNFKILTLALWCKNFDLVYYLATLKNYFKKASKNSSFLNSIEGLSKYDYLMFIVYSDILESLTEQDNMRKDIKYKNRKALQKNNINIIKF